MVGAEMCRPFCAWRAHISASAFSSPASDGSIGSSANRAHPNGSGISRNHFYRSGHKRCIHLGQAKRLCPFACDSQCRCRNYGRYRDRFSHDLVDQRHHVANSDQSQIGSLGVYLALPSRPSSGRYCIMNCLTAITSTVKHRSRYWPEASVRRRPLSSDSCSRPTPSHLRKLAVPR